MQRAYGFYRDSRGMAAAGAQVRVYDFGTTNLSTIYDDEPIDNPATPKSNPFTTDANGYWVFAAPDGAYTVQFNGANLPVYTINRLYLDEGGGGGGSAVWGGITGTLSDQTDLQSALNLKADVSSLALKADLASPTFTGDPKAPTPITSDNDTSIATTAFVKAQGYLTGNQTITASGDTTGSGTTSLPLTVVGIRGASIPALSAGFLKYTGSAWTFDSASYITGNQNITLSGDATGSGTTAITVAINTFSGSTKGLVPTSLGGTTNFLRADGSWAAPPGGGGATWTEVEIDFGSKPVYSKTFAITDGTVSGTSKIVVAPCGKPATGGFEDDWEWDNISLAANPGTGTFSLMAAAMPGPVSGKRKVQYSVM